MNLCHSLPFCLSLSVWPGSQAGDSFPPHSPRDKPKLIPKSQTPNQRHRECFHALHSLPLLLFLFHCVAIAEDPGSERWPTAQQQRVCAARVWAARCGRGMGHGHGNGHERGSGAGSTCRPSSRGCRRRRTSQRRSPSSEARRAPMPTPYLAWTGPPSCRWGPRDQETTRTTLPSLYIQKAKVMHEQNRSDKILGYNSVLSLHVTGRLDNCTCPHIISFLYLVVFCLDRHCSYIHMYISRSM